MQQPDLIVLVRRHSLSTFVPDEGQDVRDLWDEYASIFWVRKDVYSMFLYKGGRLRDSLHKTVIS